MGVVKIQYKDLKVEEAIECDHCRKLSLKRKEGWDSIVSGFDKHGDPVDFCDIECAEAEGYDMCEDCLMWYPKEEIKDYSGTRMCKCCTSRREVEDQKSIIKKENHNMEKQNQIVTVANEVRKLAEDFNNALATRDAYESDYEWDETIRLRDNFLTKCLNFVYDLGYKVVFSEHECGNPYLWNEYDGFKIQNVETMEERTIACKSYFTAEQAELIKIERSLSYEDINCVLWCQRFDDDPQNTNFDPDGIDINVPAELTHKILKMIKDHYERG